MKNDRELIEVYNKTKYVIGRKDLIDQCEVI